MRESQLQKFCNELKSRLRVLKKLGHIDADGVVQLKGWTTCLIDTGDELLITEQMFNGTFNDLDHHQVAALASCFIPGEKSNEQIHLRTELGKPLLQLQESTRRIAEIQRECKLEVNVEEYVESTVIIFFKDVIYCWPKGATFAEVIEMTDRFEGSIMPLSRRLDEFLNQLRAAAGAMGDVYFESKFATSSESLRKVTAGPIHGILSRDQAKLTLYYRRSMIRSGGASTCFNISGLRGAGNKSTAIISFPIRC